MKPTPLKGKVRTANMYGAPVPDIRAAVEWCLWRLEQEECFDEWTVPSIVKQAFEDVLE